MLVSVDIQDIVDVSKKIDKIKSLLPKMDYGIVGVPTLFVWIMEVDYMLTNMLDVCEQAAFTIRKENTETLPCPETSNE